MCGEHDKDKTQEYLSAPQTTMIVVLIGLYQELSETMANKA
jgi:hypothetical protein